MMKIKGICLFSIMFVLFINIVGAVSQIEINVDSVFFEGDNIEFSYTILSDREEYIKYFASVNCENNPLALVEINGIILRENESFSENYVEGIVTKNTNAGNCIAFVSILEPYQLNIEKPFRIETSSSFLFDIKLNKKIFLQNENIVLDYNSEISNPVITATLTYPDKITKQITLPYSFKAEQLGTYELEVTASKDGHKTITKKTQVGVIENKANVGYVIKYNGEVLDMDKEDNKYLLYILMGFILIVLIISFLITYFIKKRQETG